MRTKPAYTEDATALCGGAEQTRLPVTGRHPAGLVGIMALSLDKQAKNLLTICSLCYQILRFLTEHLNKTMRMRPNLDLKYAC
jgi:hypothetical protein